MSTFDLDSLLLLSSILVPLMVGAFLLFGAFLNKATRCWISALGFGYPLVVAVLLACFFEANPGAYNYELCLPTGLQSIGIYLHLGLNAVSMPLFLLAGKSSGFPISTSCKRESRGSHPLKKCFEHRYSITPLIRVLVILPLDS